MDKKKTGRLSLGTGCLGRDSAADPSGTAPIISDRCSASARATDLTKTWTVIARGGPFGNNGSKSRWMSKMVTLCA